ncbi:MAG: hypothetical protein U0Q22_13135 [Acidimicrobiales bacterium]
MAVRGFAHLSDKRVARRVPTLRDVAWTVPRRRRLRTVPETGPARLVNVSVTGLGLIAPTEKLVVLRSRVSVICDGHECMADVRRILGDEESGVGPGESYYALELISPSRSFLEAALERTELAARREYEGLWNHAG